MKSEDFNPQVQALFLRAMITEPEIFLRCQGIIKSEYFDQSLRKTVKFIMEYANDYNSLPTCEQIQAHCGVVIDRLETVPSQQEQKFYLDEIEQFCRHKALIKAILDCTDHLQKGDENRIEKTIQQALTVSLQKDLGLDYFADPRARLEFLRTQKGNMSTGWQSVDQKLYNVGRGELLLFAAPSGGGKSVVLQNLAVNMILQNFNVLFLTLELSEELTAKRIDSMLTGIPNQEIYKKLDDVEMQVKMTAKRAANLTIKYFNANSTNCLQIKSYLKEYEIQKGHVPDVLIVDYLDLLSPNDSRIKLGDFFIKDKMVSEELRSLGKEFNMLAVSASQFNRSSSEASEFDHSHIAGGKSKIDTSDNVIGIHNTSSLRDRGEIRFQYLKTRNSSGVGQYTNLTFDIDTLRILDLDPSAETLPSSSSQVINDIISRQNPSVTPSQVTRNQNTASSGSPNQNLQDLIKRARKT
jgi:replicative DNA helicase